MKKIILLINWSFDRQHIDVLFMFDGKTISTKRKTPRQAHEWINEAMSQYFSYTFVVDDNSDKDAVQLVFNS